MFKTARSKHQTRRNEIGSRSSWKLEMKVKNSKDVEQKKLK